MSSKEINYLGQYRGCQKLDEDEIVNSRYITFCKVCQKMMRLKYEVRTGIDYICKQCWLRCCGDLSKEWGKEREEYKMSGKVIAKDENKVLIDFDDFEQVVYFRGRYEVKKGDKVDVYYRIEKVYLTK
jgi:hypothetical protein